MTQDKTTGKAALELQEKKEEINAVDLQREIHKGTNSKRSFEEEVAICVERGRSTYEKDFYVVVLLKKERLLHNVVRQLFFHRESCPTPEFDQILYKYHKERDELEFIWVIPDKQFIDSLPLLRETLPDEQTELINFAYKFRNKDLDRLSAKLNGEIMAIV